MLTDPFYDPAPAYSPNHTGIIDIPPEIGTDAISLLSAMKRVLEQAEWTLADAEHSIGYVYGIASQFPVVVVPTVPVVPGPHPLGCDVPLAPQWVQAVFDGMQYLAYDPYTQIRPLGCEDRVYYPAGTTLEKTAENLAAGITGGGGWTVTFLGLETEPGMPASATKVNFKVTSSAPAWENDAKQILIGGGGAKFTSGGYYTLKSPTTDEGGFLECMLQSVAMAGVFGIDENAVFGALTPFLTVGASAGGEYSQAIYPSGPYLMCASRHQFAIWSELSGQRASAMVASMPKPDKNHLAGANMPLVYGSESYSWRGSVPNFQQVTTQLHWDASYATGHNNTLIDMGYRTQELDLAHWRNPTLLHKGLRSMPLKTANGSAPLVTSAYTMVSADPNGQIEVQIGGRLWDMIVASDSALFTGLLDQDGMALYDSFHWQKLATATMPGDLTSSLWVKVEMGGG